MAAIKDFRAYAFDHQKVEASGKNIGSRVYWKLFAIENLVRVLVHSILLEQAGSIWWNQVVDPAFQRQINGRVRSYAAQPWHSVPGSHDIYYTYLSDLNKIISSNSHLFEIRIPDIDQWIARIEQVRVPRNVVGHMNWPSAVDRQRIDVFYSDIKALLNGLVKAGLQLTNP
ncbi:MAG TPA: hypothetical protein VGT99_08525 [Gammaproteobacteria bacterium]|nr:hypothetical protein [Gammaproteobacteria bacterium]